MLKLSSAPLIYPTSLDPTVTSDPQYSLWESQKIENLNFLSAVVKMYSN